jgi:hypothetical protein
VVQTTGAHIPTGSETEMELRHDYHNRCVLILSRYKQLFFTKKESKTLERRLHAVETSLADIQASLSAQPVGLKLSRP